MNKINSQVYPSTCRGVAAGISSALGYLSGFLANKLFNDMYSAFTLLGTFWFYSGVAFVGVVILYFVLPETENKSLLEIEANFDATKREYFRQQQIQQNRDQQSPTTSNKVRRDDLIV